MSARKVGQRPGRRGGSEDGNRRNAETADRLREAHKANPDEIDVAIAELDANQAFRQQQARRQP